MTDPATQPAISARAMKIFALAAILWAVAGVLICWRASAASLAAHENMRWFLGFWVLSLFNLLALAMTVREVLALIASLEKQPEIRFIRAIRAFSWGTVKLICVGIFLAVLLHSKDAWLMGRLLGAGTLIVVPLFGGLGDIGYAYRRV